MRSVLPIALALSLIACTSLSDVAPGRDADKDPGGPVILRMVEIASLEARGVEKRISGQCLSACTMYLGLSTSCFEPGATLGFHGPRLAFEVEMSDATFEVVTGWMARYYPPRIAQWFMAEARYSQTIVLVPAADLIVRGEARACDAT